ncbi:hypothetical protein PUMCH_000772 [Australozyma saopauloensis]|uniref:Uncharacterized protein n=1 Tax=Australozyma saopauloensis TaxID=291208 RepID=A0AAX4H4N3_9ASCO|nr:hypothetical protein PUMCH_000772 [[Candida] saopauloensis]
MAQEEEAVKVLERTDSLVSSVGFHTLNKQISRASSNSSDSSRSTFGRLFTTKDQNQLLIHDNGNGGNEDKSVKGLSSKSRFFSPRGFLKSRHRRNSATSSISSSQSLAITNLTIDLKQSRKLERNDSNLLLPQLSAPFHPRFSGLDNETMPEMKSAHHKSGKQTALSLSSQKSNSVVVDARLASIFYCAQAEVPDEVLSPILDTGRFLEFHRKYLESTDHYMQSKLQRSISDEEGNRVNSKELSHKVDLDQVSREYELIFNRLFEIIRPVLLPSKQVSLSNGLKHPALNQSMDRVMRFVHDEISKSGVFQYSTTKEPDIRKTINNNETRTVSLFFPRSNSESTRKDARVEVLLKSILVFYQKSVEVLANEFIPSADLSAGLSIKGQAIFTSLPGNFDKQITKYLQQWTKIDSAWRYFNEKVRYSLLNALFYVQKSLYDVQKRSSKSYHTLDFNLDKQLNTIFRNVFIVSQLKQRYIFIEKQKKGQFPDIVEAEARYLQKDSFLMGDKLTKLFGIITNRTRIDINILDELLPNDSLFCDYQTWLNQLTRLRPTY